MDDLITSIGSKRGEDLSLQLTGSYTGLNAFEHEPPVIPVVHHFLSGIFPFPDQTNTVLPIFVS